jgi:hypothetical protein
MLKRYFSILLPIFGLLLFVAGFIYDVIFAGIPYQDPTPEMSKQYALHSGIASTICKIGFGVFFVGLFTAIIQLVIRRARKSPVS